jgi:hypothetical protein
MSDPPVVRLLGHPSGAGSLLEWRRRANGQWEALVEIIEDAPGYRGGLQEPRAVWFGAHEVEPVKGQDYRKVKRTYE